MAIRLMPITTEITSCDASVYVSLLSFDEHPVKATFASSPHRATAQI